MRLTKFLAVSAFSSLFVLTSCSEEVKLEDLKSIDATNVVTYADIKNDERVKTLKISKEESVLKKYQEDSTFVNAYTGENFQIFKQTTDKIVSLFIYSVNKLDTLKESYFAYNNIETIDLSSSSLENSLLSSTGTLDTESFRLLYDLKEVNFTNMDFGATTSFKDLFWILDDPNSSKTSVLETVDFTGAKLDNVTSTETMFSHSPVTTIKGLDTSSVTDFTRMFEFSKSETVTINTPINTSSATTLVNMFAGSKMTSFDFSAFDTTNVTDFSRMFMTSSFEEIDLSTFTTTNATKLVGMFAYSDATSLDLSTFDTTNVTDMNSMFLGSKATTITINSSNFKTTNVLRMFDMFNESKVTSFDFSGFDTSNVVTMAGMFENSELTSLDLSSFDTRKVVTMNNMFKGLKLTTLDLSNFNTALLQDTSAMFANSLLTSVTINKTNFTTNLVTNMSYMFADSKITSFDFSGFNTSALLKMKGMFKSSVFTALDLSTFDTSKVKDMQELFMDATVLESLNISAFTFDNVTTIKKMFFNTGSKISGSFTITITSPLNLTQEREPSTAEIQEHPDLTAADKVLDHKESIIVVTDALTGAAAEIVSKFKS